jgi:hypothetical protein
MSPEPTQRHAHRDELDAPISSEPTQPQSDRRDLGSPISTLPAPRQTDREEVAVLLNRGKDLIASGDLVAARLLLQPASYDPYVLGDVAMARAWYEKARQLGLSSASRRLQMLSSGAHFASTVGAQVIAICDMDSSKLDRGKRLYPSVVITKEFRDLLTDSRIDAIATPIRQSNSLRCCEDVQRRVTSHIPRYVWAKLRRIPIFQRLRESHAHPWPIY